MKRIPIHLGPVNRKNILNTLVVLSMENNLVDKVTSKLEFISRLKIFLETASWCVWCWYYNFFIIYLINPHTLCNWRVHATIYSLNDDLSFIALSPRLSFSTSSKGECTRNSSLRFDCITKVPGRCHMPYRHEHEKHWDHCRLEMGFSCIKCDNIR